ncbi:hypothetical protein SAMN04488128_1011918 [Chitinophaga eiseniae]|uniref:Uncharacterized protein n=1 Tax=Chitinophaga eiseniae TaxID=634771 RepID=A0A1T4P4U9_9BACT|nr:hypothetical protein SAMN04488128_1011918 [Chitinophaga eiseniae]
MRIYDKNKKNSIKWKRGRMNFGLKSITFPNLQNVNALKSNFSLLYLLLTNFLFHFNQ